jgi:hypothetical protein
MGAAVPAAGAELMVTISQEIERCPAMIGLDPAAATVGDLPARQVQKNGRELSSTADLC